MDKTRVIAIEGAPLEEIRLWVQGYEELYEVSNTGRLRSTIKGKVRELKPDYSKSGYISYRLSKLGKSKKFSVHRLVAASFLGLDLNDKTTVVCHKDNDGTNNFKSNLYLGTQKQNIEQSVLEKRHYSTSNERLDMSINNAKLNRKLSDYDIVKIAYKYEGGETTQNIAKDYGVDVTTITNNLRKYGFKYPYGLSKFPRGLNMCDIEIIKSSNDWNTYKEQGRKATRDQYYKIKKKIINYITTKDE